MFPYNYLHRFNIPIQNILYMPLKHLLLLTIFSEIQSPSFAFLDRSDSFISLISLIAYSTPTCVKITFYSSSITSASWLKLTIKRSSTNDTLSLLQFYSLSCSANILTSWSGKITSRNRPNTHTPQDTYQTRWTMASLNSP